MLGKSKYASRNLVLISMLLLLSGTLSCFAQEEGKIQSDVSAKIETADGLEKVEFDTLTGTVEVNLPDDLADTDTISGTVLTEPKGETKEEIAQNESELMGYVVEIVKTQEVQEPPSTTKIPPAEHVPPRVITGVPLPPKSTPPCDKPTICKDPPCVNVVPGKTPDFTCSIPQGTPNIVIRLTTRNGQTVCQQSVRCRPHPQPLATSPGWRSRGRGNTAAPTPSCQLPTTAISSRPLRIRGICDGRLATSRISVNRRPCIMLAESPRQQICQPSAGVTGRCEIERSEAGSITRGWITMRPAPIVATVVPAKPSRSQVQRTTAPIKYTFRRTGPFVTQEQASCYVNQGNRVSISEGQITWTGPESIPGDPMVSATVVFQSPPEIITVGDKFSVSASISGDEHVSTQGQFNEDHSWIKTVGSRGRSVTLSPGYGEPTLTRQFEVTDYKQFLKDAIKQYPDKAHLITPEIEQKLPSISFFCPGRVNVKIEWKYVPIK
jgi:hypothetical protein